MQGASQFRIFQRLYPLSLQRKREYRLPEICMLYVRTVSTQIALKFVPRLSLQRLARFWGNGVVSNAKLRSLQKGEVDIYNRFSVTFSHWGLIRKMVSVLRITAKVSPNVVN